MITVNEMRTLLAAVIAVCGLAAHAAEAPKPVVEVKRPPIQPTPKSITVNAGDMALTLQSRIIATDPRLEAHAAVLRDEILCITNWRLNIVAAKDAAGAEKAGDIILKINPKIQADEDILAPENVQLVRTRNMAHTVSVTDKVVVEGWDVRATCEGTASVIQSIAGANGKFSIPHMTIKDWPHADFTAIMVDCGRQWIPADALKASVEACRLFKIRYLQLHVGDDQGYSFPSKAFPKMGKGNGSCCGGIPPKVWTWEEMEELEAYAVARGVTIIPTIETPGHHAAMARNYRHVFDGPGCMNMASEDLYKGLETIMDEMLSVFKSTPYFDIGCDEANWQGVGSGGWGQVYKRRHAVMFDPQPARNPHELYQVHLKRLADMLRKKGRLTLAWEDFPRDDRLKDDIIALIWYPHAVAHEYQKAGWTTITVPWELGVPFPAWNMYMCNGSVLKRTDRVLGACRPMWQMSAITLAGPGGWKTGGGERQERTWGPDTPIVEEEYRKRYDLNNKLADRLILPVRIETEGINFGNLYFLGGQIGFGGEMKVSLSVVAPTGGQIRYTLDGSEPNAQSPVYTQPFAYKKSLLLNAALFFGDKQFGSVTRSRYDYRDIDGFIPDWELTGPFTKEGITGKEQYDFEFPPEKGESVKWFPWKPNALDPTFVRFNDIGLDVQGVMYMRTQIYSPKAQKARLIIAANDSGKVFLNGAVVFNKNVARKMDHEDTVDVELTEGWNKVLFKVNHERAAHTWAAKARIRAADGKPLEGIKTKAE